MGTNYRYSPDNTGSYHWSGSTSDSRNPLDLKDNIKAKLRKQEGWKIK
ncbi:hypothetical protein [Commensalibacter nepenthis]|uniref:Uncharacterized protein n=1 Tax=Commensalibacter nepenthis TaxID=3043872 RepID=A0ABT6QAK1_9PROT|nr:hypothetical protein [Commensalibacter sp. TBRC 10068]MDI2113782.1 hypothetical protein [Commensalibacter sp. TBRC 10068]